MEWLVLILVVPAILIPIILLWGFAGCSFHGPPISVSKPTNVQATGTSISVIRISWDGDPSASSFEIERTKEGESVPTVLPVSSSPFDDTGLSEATSYFYQVRALRASDSSVSPLSDSAPGRTIGVVFQNVFTDDQSQLEGFCIVQRIEPTRLRLSTVPGDASTPGARVRITIRGSTQASLTINHVTISRVAAAGDPYDSAPDLTMVSGQIGVPANTPVVLPDVAYGLDHSQTLIVAFDISLMPSSGNVRLALNVPATDGIMYFKQTTAEAAIADRAPSAANPGASPFVPSPCIYLVDKIEVV